MSECYTPYIPSFLLKPIKSSSIHTPRTDLQNNGVFIPYLFAGGGPALTKKTTEAYPVNTLSNLPLRSHCCTKLWSAISTDKCEQPPPNLPKKGTKLTFFNIYSFTQLNLSTERRAGFSSQSISFPSIDRDSRAIELFQ